MDFSVVCQDLHTDVFFMYLLILLKPLSPAANFHPASQGVAVSDITILKVSRTKELLRERLYKHIR